MAEKKAIRRKSRSCPIFSKTDALEQQPTGVLHAGTSTPCKSASGVFQHGTPRTKKAKKHQKYEMDKQTFKKQQNVRSKLTENDSRSVV